MTNLKLSTIKVADGFLLVDLIFTPTKIQSGIKLLTPQANTASVKSFYDHPFRAKVIASCEYFYNGGSKYQSEVKAGEIILLRDNPHDSTTIVIEGVLYLLIRYSEYLIKYTASDEEIKETKYLRDVSQNESPILKN